MPSITAQQKAIAAALKRDWKAALQINKELIKKSKDDTDALNRLAKAYAELGDLKRAKTTSNRVLRIDPTNQIASKSLEKWDMLNASNGLVKKTNNFSLNMFLEEPGKTRIINLLHIGDEKLLASIDSGDEVKISCNKHRVSILTKGGKYIGRLPDDISSRIRNLIKIGNEYIALVKKVDAKEVLIFIRETKRSPKMKDIATFSTEKVDYISFTPPELVHKRKPNVATLEEEAV